jgi:tetratricopeptide (TPR) repeat protein
MAGERAGTSRSASWHRSAHEAWEQGKREHALAVLRAALDEHGAIKPVPLALQMAYYLFLIGDFQAAAAILEEARPHHPDDPGLLLNLAVCLTNIKQTYRAIAVLTRLVELQPQNFVVWDGLCHNLSDVGRLQEAAETGTTALRLKDQAQSALDRNWVLPCPSPSHWAPTGRPSVIAFSLWGTDPRYLRGALDNAIAIRALYPDWTARFYVDASAPRDVRDALSELGADVRLESEDAPLRRKLGWRFKVAEDPSVGRFLVRDADAVVNEREKTAVNAWLASDRWFHVMRDWWTHTDVMLAGMWGGVSGVLPPLTEMLEHYRSPSFETPNIDQWFLRDQVWAYVRQSCLVHDRCFSPPGANPWPIAAPRGTDHVGHNEYNAHRSDQAGRLAPWAQRVPSLQLA